MRERGGTGGVLGERLRSVSVSSLCGKGKAFEKDKEDCDEGGKRGLANGPVRGITGLVLSIDGE